MNQQVNTGYIHSTSEKAQSQNEQIQSQSEQVQSHGHAQFGSGQVQSSACSTAVQMLKKTDQGKKSNQ